MHRSQVTEGRTVVNNFRLCFIVEDSFHGVVIVNFINQNYTLSFVWFQSHTFVLKLSYGVNVLLVMAWNNYPIYIVKAFLKRQLKDKPEKQPEPHDLIKIYLKVPYLGKQGEQLVTVLVRKVHRYLKPNVKLIKLLNTKKASMLCPTKDKVTKEQKTSVIYKIICPGCNNVYVGKTDHCFGIRMNEHGTRLLITAFQETVNINELPELFNDSKQIDHKAHVLNGVLNNCDIIDSNDNWSQLCFLEAFYIKKLSPSINNGLKASKELQLFC